jgi:hypothetical protein
MLTTGIDPFHLFIYQLIGCLMCCCELEKFTLSTLIYLLLESDKKYISNIDTSAHYKDVDFFTLDRIENNAAGKENKKRRELTRLLFQHTRNI